MIASIFSGLPKAQTLNASIETFPLRYIDTHVVDVGLRDVFLGLKDRVALPFTHCEVYTRLDVLLNVCGGEFFHDREHYVRWIVFLLFLA